MFFLARFGYILMLAVLPLITEGQQKYWIYLNHKNHLGKICAAGSCRAQHLSELEEQGISPLIYSEWLSAASAFMNEGSISSLSQKPFVDSIRPLDTKIRILATANNEAILDDALEQIHAEALVEEGLSGKNIKIGIIDAGFYRANKLKSLYYVFERDGFKGYKNFIETEISDPFSKMKNNDYHGTRVWELIAGYKPDNQRGLARDADFYLARTDEDPREYRGEEDFWIAAVEWMASQGVQIINSSLGYADGHDDPAEDYIPSDADGSSSALSRFAKTAVYEKGLLIIMSAGNSGSDNFGVVNIPADAPGVIAVGATNLNFWTKQGYSSIGKFTLPNIKPDVACFSPSGTSFSAPVITGFAACLMEADSTLSNLEIAELIRASGHLRYFPNNYLGYGVPDARLALSMLRGRQPGPGVSDVLFPESDVASIELQAVEPVIFHKTNTWEVHHEEFRLGSGQMWEVKRPSPEITHSTFAIDKGAIEIIWPDH